MSPVLFLTQMLPLLIFIIADAIFNNVKISIVLAIICAAIQFGLVYRVTRQIDWFILLDVGLIVGLGIVSILLKNELFFKIKPVIINVAAVIFFLVLIFSSDSFLAGYFGRMMKKGTYFRPEALGIMKATLAWFCVYIAFHSAAVLYTAFFSTRKMWALVSGPGFYLLFIPVMIVILFKNFKQRRFNLNKTNSIPNKQIIKRK